MVPHAGSAPYDSFDGMKHIDKVVDTIKRSAARRAQPSGPNTGLLRPIRELFCPHPGSSFARGEGWPVSFNVKAVACEACQAIA